MTRYIVLAGKKQVGKDTSANMIRDIICPPWTCEQVQADVDGFIEHEKFEKSIHIVHFADALKKATSAIFGIPLSEMETESGKQSETEIVWPSSQLRKVGNTLEHEVVGYIPHHPQGGKPKMMTVREILQFVGTELFRLQMDPDIWVKSIFRRRYRDDDIILVADCRFPNEASYSRERGLLIKVERNTPHSEDQHLSETALDAYNDYHYIVENNGSFTDLKEQLRIILTKEDF